MEYMPPGHKLIAKRLEVINLPIEDNPDCLVFVGHGLIAG